MHTHSPPPPPKKNKPWQPFFLSQIEKSPQFHNFRVTKGKSLLPVIISKPGQRFPTMSEKKNNEKFQILFRLRGYNKHITNNAR